MTEVAIRMRACVAMATAFAAFCAYADVPITAVPPASFRGVSSDKTVVPKMTLAPTARQT